MRRVFTVCFFTFLVSLQVLAQEPRPKRRVTITLKDDKTMTGYFVRADESGVVVETDDARTTIKLDSVKLIAFGNIPTGSQSSPVSRIDRGPNLRVEQYGLAFELTEVRMSGGSVICELTITSTERDSEMTIYGGDFNGNVSRLYDESGGEYRVGTARLGSRSGPTVSLKLVAGVPVKASLRFINVPQEINRVTLLNLGLYTSNVFASPVYVQFRNIPIEK